MLLVLLDSRRAASRVERWGSLGVGVGMGVDVYKDVQCLRNNTLCLE
jgi:hypothetical protein